VWQRTQDERHATRVRIALFITCLGDVLFPEAGRATVEVLERLGHTVVFPEGQTCCGQMHANSGYDEEAMPLVRRFVSQFEDERFEAVVAPSGSCVAMVRHHYPRLAAAAGDARLEGAARALGERVFELSELLVRRLGVEDVGAYYPHRVVYHPSCHGLRTLGVGDAPLRLLRAVRGIDLQELPGAETCCGFGGTFAVKNPDVSAAMLGDKLQGILQTGAEVCTALDSSCLMHIGGGLTRLRSGVRSVHLAEILATSEGRVNGDGRRSSR
jgi:L-lactate dehydrogenase complex protein LldE